MLNTTATIPGLLNIMFPVVLIHITSLCHLHAVQTESVEVVEKLLACFFDCRVSKPSSAGHASAFWDHALEIDETSTIQNLLDRPLVVFVEWPDTCLAEADLKCKKGFLLAAAGLDEEIANRVKETSQ
jgi:hypothetical protein